MARHRVALCLLCVFLQGISVLGHGDRGSTGAPCLRNVGASLQASYVPGTITVDGLADDWKSVNGRSFALLPALNDDAKKAYPGGSLEIKVAHDGQDIFFLLQVPGAYVHNSVEPRNMASVALMFPVGDDATYHNMGGCPELAGSCNASSCFGHEVDLIHFELSTAIPGRLYGSNLLDNINGTGKDSFGDLNDGYAWNPHCRYADGTGPTGVTGGGMNDWRGSWTHSTMDTTYGFVVTDSPYATADGSGTYTFEFARKLRTNDVLQQDAQFKIGATCHMASVIWYPVGGAVWQPFQHYSASCDWLPLEIQSASSGMTADRTGSALSILSFLVSLMSVAVAVAVGWWVRQSSRMSFNPISSSGL